VNKETDIAVVGGGPCGSFSALTAAKLGAKVVVCEEHREIGVPTHCPGHISLRGLERLKLRLPQEIIENKVKGAVFYSPLGEEFGVRCSSPVSLVVNREALDKYLSDLAMKAGVQYLLESRAESFFLDSGFITGVTVRKRGTKETLGSHVVIDAEGCSSVLLKRAGLQTLDRSMVVNAVHAEVDWVGEVSLDTVEVYLGRRFAPGFFAWIIPKRDFSAKVGLATKKGDPRVYLRRFMRDHPIASKKLSKSKISRLSLHPIPLGGPIPKTYSNGLLIVGDAASQVKPTTGGGVIFGLLCSQMAGEVAYQAVKNRNYSENFLSRYQSRWKKAVGFDMMVMRQARKLLNHLTDEKIDKIIRLCAKLGVDKSLEEVKDLDFQGKLLIRLIQHPATSIAALYFLLTSLTSSTHSLFHESPPSSGSKWTIS